MTPPPPPPEPDLTEANPAAVAAVPVPTAHRARRGGPGWCAACASRLALGTVLLYAPWVGDGHGLDLSAPGVLGLCGLLLVPTTLLGVIKRGGDFNDPSPTVFFLMLAVLSYRRGSPGPGNGRARPAASPTRRATPMPGRTRAPFDFPGARCSPSWPRANSPAFPTGCSTGIWWATGSA